MGEAPDDRTPEAAATDGSDRESLRRRVEDEYDFDDFGPADMDRMSADEWEAAFDPDTWITGPGLLDRVERDLNERIARRDVFAVVEREVRDGEETLLAYSDEGYAIVYPDGSVEGSGTVLRDVKPTVALCSMADYDVPDGPVDASLPDPGEVPEGTGELGNLVLLTVGGVQVLAGVVLFGAWLLYGLSIIAAVIALGFLLFGVFLLVVVANARLSDRFRSEQFRQRLRDAGVDSGERPAFVPAADGDDGPPDPAVDEEAN